MAAIGRMQSNTHTSLSLSLGRHRFGPKVTHWSMAGTTGSAKQLLYVHQIMWHIHRVSPNSHFVVNSAGFVLNSAMNVHECL